MMDLTAISFFHSLGGNVYEAASFSLSNINLMKSCNYGYSALEVAVDNNNDSSRSGKL